MSSCGMPMAAMDFTRRRCSSLGLNGFLGILSSLREYAFVGHLFKRMPIAMENRGFACQLLPALDSHVDVLRIDLDPAADTACEFRRCERRATAQERFINQFPSERM